MCVLDDLKYSKKLIRISQNKNQFSHGADGENARNVRCRHSIFRTLATKCTNNNIEWGPCIFIGIAAAFEIESENRSHGNRFVFRYECVSLHQCGETYECSAMPTMGERRRYIGYLSILWLTFTASVVKIWIFFFVHFTSFVVYFRRLLKCLPQIVSIEFLGKHIYSFWFETSNWIIIA